MVGDKFRFRFRKAGVLRLLSHHDLMRCFERMLRRAEIPFKSTGGFHPTPRVVFALSLPLGVVGSHEVVELELTEPRDSDDVLTRLASQAPIGLSFHSCTAIPMKARAVPRRAIYALPIPADRLDRTWNHIGDLLASSCVWVNRFHPRPRQVNIRPYLRNLEIVSDNGPDHYSLRLDLWVTQQGSARADELIRQLDLHDLLDAGAVLDRIDLELHDECTTTAENDQPPNHPPETAPLNLATAPPMADDDTATEAT
jgi:radical SAM-linked protein